MFGALRRTPTCCRLGQHANSYELAAFSCQFALYSALDKEVFSPMQTIDLLRELSNAFGVSGFEDEVRDLIRALVNPHVDEVKTDTLGNLFAIRKSSNSDAKTLMLDAHMDEIGFIVKWIEKDGFLRFAPIGGWDPRIVPGHRVEIQTRSGAVSRPASSERLLPTSCLLKNERLRCLLRRCLSTSEQPQWMRLRKWTFGSVIRLRFITHS